MLRSEKHDNKMNSNNLHNDLLDRRFSGRTSAGTSPAGFHHLSLNPRDRPRPLEPFGEIGSYVFGAGLRCRSVPTRLSLNPERPQSSAHDLQTHPACFGSRVLNPADDPPRNPSAASTTGLNGLRRRSSNPSKQATEPGKAHG